MEGTIQNPDEMLARYADRTAARNGFEAPLGALVQMEAEFCPPEHQAAMRQNPDLRLGSMARMLAAAGSLDPEHVHLTLLGLPE